MPLEQKSDLEFANQALAQLKPHITAEDRKQAPACEATLVQYLNGLGKNLDTALKLLRYFRGRRDERNKELRTVN